MADLYREQFQVARKPHTCDLCRKEIHAGERYLYHVNLCDGKFWVWKFHETCNAIVCDFVETGYDDPFDIDEVREWLIDEYCRDCPKYEDCYDDFKLGRPCEKIIMRYSQNRRANDERH